MAYWLIACRSHKWRQIDKAEFHLVSTMDDLELVSTMDDLEILYQKKHYADNDTSLEPAKDPSILKLV